MGKDKEPVDIIVLNYNGLDFLKPLINSLFKNTIYPFHLFIIDNGSTEKGTKEYLDNLSRKRSEVTVHYNDENLGFSKGNNVGLDLSSHQYVLFLNNDILIPKSGWLASLVKTIEDDSSIAIVGCKLLYPNNTIQHAGCILSKDFLTTLRVFDHRGRFEPSYKYSQIEPIPAVTFATALVRRNLVTKLDESYEMGYFEDMDKCCEVRKNGYQVYYNGQVELYHYESATLYKLPSQYWQAHQLKNCFLFRERWLKWLIEDLKKQPSFYGWTEAELKILNEVRY